VGPTQDRVLALADELDLERFPTYNGGRTSSFTAGARRAIEAPSEAAGPVLADVGQAQFRLDRMARRVPLDAPWQAKRAGDWDAQTVETWLRRNMRTSGGRGCSASGYAPFLPPSRPICPPALPLLQPLRRLLDRLFNVKDGAQEERIVGGSQLLALRLAERLAGPVVLSAATRRITQDDDGVVVAADGHELRARHVVVAVPPLLAGHIDYEPGLPPWRDQLTQRMPMGSVTKCMAVYDEPFWRATV